MHYVYIVRCSDDTLYTGYTNDLDRRIQMHNDGQGAKYTKGRRPVKLVYSEEFKSKSKAMKREYEIKQLKRTNKVILIKDNTKKA
ncbi:MAG: GIY-YIG nuclease family protein [Halanaerobiales bacterium]|nr:GIY-YIG nuclease family protein [Halanaerobiales bacterium]